MKKIAWSRLIRQTHMNLALFLRPWVLVYALSSIIFNRFKFFSGGKPLAPFEQVAELPYEGVCSDGIGTREAGWVAILSGLATFVLLVLTM